MNTALHHELYLPRASVRTVACAVLLGLLLIPPTLRDGAISTQNSSVEIRNPEPRTDNGAGFFFAQIQPDEDLTMKRLIALLEQLFASFLLPRTRLQPIPVRSRRR